MYQFFVKAMILLGVLVLLISINFSLVSWLLRYVGSLTDPATITLQLVVIEIALFNVFKTPTSVTVKE